MLRRGELVEQRFGISANQEHGVVLGCKELLPAQVIKELNQEVIKSASIENSDRLEVKTKLKPGESLDELLQRADPARQRDERVGELCHPLFALVHGFDRDQLRQALVCAALGNHRTWYYANSRQD